MMKHAKKLPTQRRGLQNCPVAVMIISFVIILAVSGFILSSKREQVNSSFDLSKRKWNRFQSSVQFQPTVEFRNETEVIWQIPDSPKAVLFLAHGCNGRAINFWDRCVSCQNCIGLPEERLIVLHALARKFAVITISSAGKCWSLGRWQERVIVKEIIKLWVAKNKLEKLPLVALGASSGGYFVSLLATDMRFGGITIMIAQALFYRKGIPDDYPPTLFVHMPKDRARLRIINENLVALRKKSIDVAEIACMEFPLYPNFLADRIPGLDQTVSVKLFELFRKEGLIDQNGYMKKDGRATKWKEALRETGTLLPDKPVLGHHIQEELNLAYAYHEMTSLQSEQIFYWFESHMS
ncbi:uncharacterized protein LOC122064178 [Macadamia integrifolia]|uniref:uncharacterized protein LOC122064178 n=1 Tax=Macadamia integrifolia TaxID=60698 RepID=UPI001C4EF30A|nr:uncharacterized protein LOC122064178 [Macadamia integrifolia]